MGPLSNIKREKFCQLFVSGLSQEKSYVQAGYAAGSGARAIAGKLTTNNDVAEPIRELKAKSVAKIEEALEIDAEWVKSKFLEVATADPADLAEIIVCACRCCHGIGHAYQWRKEAEAQAAMDAWHAMPEKQRDSTRPPKSNEGGYGWSRKLVPHPNCPECDGYGEPQVIMNATRGHPLFAGIKQTPHGTEIILHDRMKALENLGRILGAFKDEKGATTDADRLLDELRDLIRRSGRGAISQLWPCS